MKYYLSRFTLSVSIILTLIIGSCTKDIVEEPTVGIIAGSVSDRTTGEPVATVNVTITPGGSSTVTGSDGSFSFRNLNPGNYTLAIKKEGYKDNSSTVSVRAGDPTSAHLLIERVPAIVTADRELLDFGENASTNTLSFNIVNPGYVDLEWEIEERCEWIVEVKPAKGTLKYGKTEAIVVVIDRELLASGPNEAVIVVRSSNGSSDVKVTAVGPKRYVPQLNTLDATEITSSSATLNGEIIDAGAPAYTERGFIYSLSSMPTFDNMLAKLTVSVTDDAAYSYNLRGLTLGETYYVRAYAVNSVGTAYSTNEINFTTRATLPTVSVYDVNNMNADSRSVILRGSIDDEGTPSYFERGFVYCTDKNTPTIDDTYIKVNGTGKGTYEISIANLQLGITYYVRACAMNEGGVAYSTTSVSFKIPTSLPVIETLEPTSINRGNGTSVLHGRVVSAGSPSYTERGFVYSISYAEPTTSDDKWIVEGTGNGEFEYRATDLTNKTYYVRAYATNELGTVYGETVKALGPEYFVLDAANLAVQISDVGIGDWPTIEAMCKNSTIEGSKDWRLPTKEELMVLYNNRELIGGFKGSYYWSSTYFDSYLNWNKTVWIECYYGVDFLTGTIIRGTDGSYFNSLYGRCVRTLK